MTSRESAEFSSEDLDLIKKLSENLGVNGMEDAIKRLKKRQVAAQKVPPPSLKLSVAEGGPVTVRGMGKAVDLEAGKDCVCAPHQIKGNAEAGELPVPHDYPLPLYVGCVLSIRAENCSKQEATLVVDCSMLSPLSREGLSFVAESGSISDRKTMPRFQPLRPDREEQMRMATGAYVQIVGFRLEPSPGLFHNQSVGGKNND